MKAFITLIAVVFSTVSFSQTKQENLVELKGSKLYVTIYDTTDAASADFCKSYNRNIRDAFGSRFDFCPVDFITFDKMDVMKEKDGNAFVILPLEYNYTVQSNGDFIHNYRAGGSVSYFVMGRASDYMITTNLFGKNKAATFGKIIHKAGMSDFGYISMFIGVDYMNKSFKKGVLSKEELKARKEEQNEKKEKEGPRRAEMKTKTLLVDKSMLDKNTTEAVIKSVYKQPFKIAEASEIEDALKSKKENISFITIRMTSPTKPKDLVVVLNNNFETLGYLTIDMNADIKKDNFEELNKIAEKD